jgi:diguanylate cyclase (GGDEF)-like protein/PAS domain S-box-containing protein
MSGGDGDTGFSGLYGRVLGTINMGVVVVDDQRRILLWNQWMASHSGLSAGRVQGSDLFELFPELSGQRIEQAIHSALRNNFSALLSQTLNRTPFALYPAGTWGGERIEQAVSVTPIAAERGARHCLIQITDVSAAVGREKLLRDQAAALRAQSYADGLTGIANRRHFDVALDRELRRAQRNNGELSLLLMDIDSFKAYNDHFGHQQGDACLMLVAEAFAAMLQRPADLAARYGGEEFAAILPDTDLAQALRHAEAIRSRIASLEVTHAPAAHKPYVTLSIGVASYSSTGLADAEALLGAADRALYAAKRSGRDRVMTDDQ